jgi:hypothetical protein
LGHACLRVFRRIAFGSGSVKFTRLAVYRIEQRPLQRTGRLQGSGRSSLPDHGGQNATKQSGPCCKSTHLCCPSAHCCRGRTPQG